MPLISSNSSVRESEQENAKVEVNNDALLKEIPHGFYGDEPAGIWQPVKLTITDPVKVKMSLSNRP